MPYALAGAEPAPGLLSNFSWVDMAKTAIPSETIETAIYTHRGNITRVAASLEVTRAYIHQRVAASSRLQDAVEDARNTLVDLAENTVVSAAEGGNVVAAIAILNNHPISRARGWGQRIELTGADGGPIVLKGYTSVSPDDWADGKE